MWGRCLAVLGSGLGALWCFRGLRFSGVGAFKASCVRD